jgi:hypothetical protein
MEKNLIESVLDSNNKESNDTNLKNKSEKSK